MRSVWILALAASGCRSILGIEPPPPPIDASADAPADASDPCASWQPQGFDACATPRQAESLPPLIAGARYVYDTTTAGGTLYDPSGAPLLQSTTVLQLAGSPVAVLSLGAFVLDAPGVTLAVIGPKPLLVVSWSTITIGAGAVLDAGSHRAAVSGNVRVPAVLGAGANQGCASEVGKNGSDASFPRGFGGSGGGGGGSFGAAGGRGGLGGLAGSAPGGAGGSAVAAAAFRGGCPGGASGAAGAVATSPSSSATRAAAGAGGGAIRLVARGAIEVVGAISASGAGGAGGPMNSWCGGGGGGSGGYIGFEAPSVSLRGAVTANGGGGGSGGFSNTAGNDGADGTATALAASGGAIVSVDCDGSGTAMPAGGAGGAGGAIGQAGSTAALGGGTGADTSGCVGGGGGGGGGVGYIVATTPGLVVASGATVSPSVTP